MGITRHQVLDIDTDKLQHYENNAKLHPKEQVDQLIESIASFGFLDPIAYDENFIIIEGHGRHLAAKQMGLKLVPAFLIAGMTEPEKIAYRIFHNKSTMNSDLDLELLKGDIELLVDADFDLDLTGFGAEDISLWAEDFEEWAEKEEVQREAIEQIKATRNNGFVAELDREEPKEEDEIEVEKLLEDAGKVESRVKPGEIWQLGRHKIACGDSTIQSNVIALLGDRFDEVGMVWADPPYGISIVANNGFVGGGEAYDYPFGGLKNIKNKGAASDNSPKVVKAKKYAPIIGDATTNTAVNSFVISFSLFEKATHFWWGGNYYASSMPDTSCWIVWDKENTCNFADAELAWSNHKSAVRIFKHMWNGMVKASEHGQKRVHPTQKPIALCEWVFEKYGTPNDVIFDPFLGSAPSIIAAQKMDGDRVVYGFELSPDYCEVIIKRFEQFTGDTAKLVGSL